MRIQLATFAVLSLLSAAAFADDEKIDKEEAQPTEEVDCSTLEGEDKTACEAKQAAESEEPKKSGKGLTKSDDNRLEMVEDDE